MPSHKLFFNGREYVFIVNGDAWGIMPDGSYYYACPSEDLSDPRTWVPKANALRYAEAPEHIQSSIDEVLSTEYE